MKETAKGTWVTERYLEEKKQEFVVRQWSK